MAHPEVRCRHCKRKVIFARDEMGKWVCLDVVAPIYTLDNSDPNPKHPNRCHRTTKALVVHFVNCPKMQGQWKREQEKK